MKGVICDTNIFISLFKGYPETITSLEKIGNDQILVPSITVMELLRGMENKKELNAMSKKISRYNILHFNEEVSLLALKLVEEYKLSHNLEIPDAIIAAMSLVYDFPLFTYNVKDFKFIPKINLYMP